jgi:hypothetical protein
MGFFRKKFKQIKKKIKKLLGGKFGKILGGLGMAMMFWGGANALFGKTNWFKGLKTNLNKMNPFAKGDITSAVEVAGKTVTDTAVAGGTETLKSQALAGAAESAKAGIELAKTTSGTLTDIPFSQLDLGQKIAKVGVETKDFLLPDVSSVGEFAADVTRSMGQQYVIGALEGEPEVRTAGFGKTPETVNVFEPAQDAILRQVQSQIPNLQATNFNQLNQSLYYGTLSPHYVAEQAREMGLVSQIPGR